MTRAIFAATILLTATQTPAVAQVDSHLDEAYHLRVVLDIAPNRFLTPIFRDQVARELRDLLRLNYGDLAKVDVVRNHPKLSVVRAKGLQRALDGWERLSDRKTHFVLVDFKDGRYSIAARQYDGSTGLASPGVSRATITDRKMVAQEAARLVDQDFGLVGTVIKVRPHVEIAIRGGKLGVRLERWVKPGDVFAVTRVVQDGGRARSVRLRWALLRVERQSEPGIYRCSYFHRFAQDRLQLGDMCLELRTTRAPLHLRLIHAKTFQPLGGVQVHVHTDSYNSKAHELSTNASGFAKTNETYETMALVEVLSDNRVQARFPVAIVDDEPIVCRLQKSRGAETLSLLEYRRDQWVRSILDNLLAASNRVKLLNKRIGKNSLQETLSYAKRGLRNLNGQIERLHGEQVELVREAQKKSIGLDKLDLSEGMAGLQALRVRRKRLLAFIDRLENSIKEKPKRQALQKLLERARLLESEAEYDQAIEAYRKFLEQVDEPGVAKHVKELVNDWRKAKNEKQREARKFLLKTWPQMKLTDLQDKVEAAKEKFQLLRKLDDLRAIRKLLRINLMQARKLKKRLEVLGRFDSEDNRTEAQNIVKVSDALRDLHKQIVAYLKQRED